MKSTSVPDPGTPAGVNVTGITAAGNPTCLFPFGHAYLLANDDPQSQGLAVETLVYKSKLIVLARSGLVESCYSPYNCVSTGGPQ